MQSVLSSTICTYSVYLSYTFSKGFKTISFYEENPWLTWKKFWSNFSEFLRLATIWIHSWQISDIFGNFGTKMNRFRVFWFQNPRTTSKRDIKVLARTLATFQLFSCQKYIKEFISSDREIGFAQSHHQRSNFIWNLPLELIGLWSKLYSKLSLDYMIVDCSC